MSWMTFDPDQAQAQAEKALRIPIGAASPLWLAYGGMAVGATAYWWMSQWMKPLNLEALSWPKTADVASLFPVPAIVETPAEVETPVVAKDTSAPSVETGAPTAVEPISAAVEPVAQAMEVAVDTAAKMVEAPLEAAPAIPDDLTALVGIGPTLATKLADLGVKSYADIAAWTAADVETFDKQLKLIGRITRDDWVGQAKQLAAAAA